MSEEIDVGACIAWMTDKQDEEMFKISPGSGCCPYHIEIDRSEKWDPCPEYIRICSKYGYINKSCSDCKCSLQEEGIPVIKKKGVNIFINEGTNDEGVDFIEIEEIIRHGKLRAPGVYFGSQVAIAWFPEEEELATAVRNLMYDIFNVSIKGFAYWYEPTEETLKDILECRNRYLEEEDNDG